MDNFEAETLFQEILKKIEGLWNAIVFIDECESILGRRDVLSQGASVYVQSLKTMVGNFIKWAEGLQTTDYSKQRLCLVMATNLKDDLDPAIRDRARTTVAFELPVLHLDGGTWRCSMEHLT